MMMFFQLYLWVVFFLSLFSLCGAFAVMPFARTIKYPAFMAPMMGLFLVVLGTSVFYDVFQCTLSHALSITLIICIVTTAITCWQHRKSTRHFFGKQHYTQLLLFVLFLIGLVTYITCFSNIDFKETAFLFSDGSDHSGYAAVADWLNHHLVMNRPEASPNAISESWPNLMFKDDIRFGSFFTIAIISSLFHESGFFSFDITCAIALCAAYMGIAALFTRSRLTFTLLTLGLLTNSWLDYAGSGFLGKILGYSSFFFVLGLFLTTKRPFSLPQITVLLITVLMTSIMHFALATTCFIFVIAGLFLLFQRLTRENTLQKDDILLWLLMLGLSIASTGIFALPSTVKQHLLTKVFDIPLENLLIALFDVDGIFLKFSHLSVNTLIMMALLFNAIILFFLIIAIKQRKPASIALLLAPYLFLMGIVLDKQYWIGLQLISLFYTWFLCGAILLIDSNKQNKHLFYGLLTLFILAIALHMPRFLGIVQRYAGQERLINQTFIKKEMQALAHATQHKIVTVDMNNIMFVLPLVIEISDEPNQFLQLTEPAWNAVVGYRQWPAIPLKPTPYKIILKTDSVPDKCTIQQTTQQYYLLACPSSFY